MAQYYRVAVDAPLMEPLTYLPPADASPLPAGSAVKVPLGRRLSKGIVLESTDSAGDYQLKPIADVFSDLPPLPIKFLKWLEWLSQYYLFPIGLVMSLAFPALAKKERKGKSRKSPLIPQVPHRPAPVLNSEQRQCFESIGQSQGFQVHLLHGVTGSGKTEVYLHLLAEVLERGQYGLVLVPEISLTPQLIERFAARFGDQIAVLHSHLTDREKTEQWWAVVSGQKKILIGARSALFCPIANLGLIVIDEEHEPSFKQDEKLKYHARDAAIMLAKFSDCPIVMGSATPSLESWHHATSGKYSLHSMHGRVADRAMPLIEVVDLRDEREKQRELGDSPERLPFWLSTRLYESMVETLGRQEQVALFLNRRGVAQLALCGDCGHTFECPNCAISLTLHGTDHLVCHYCDYSERLKERCPQCSSSEVRPLGLGTELIEQDVARLFPTARLARADRDEIHSRESLEEMIRAVEHREIDILIGTQMIAKGLDFPGLTLVGLVLADVGFNLPDFRAAERSFQLLTQVSGRSGRHSLEPGRVIIQTYNPDHPAIVYTCQHDYAGFAAQELAVRQELRYPPFSRLGLFRLQGQTLDRAESGCRQLKQRAFALQKSRPQYETLQWLGPAPAPLAKLRGKYRFQSLVKADDPTSLHAFCKQLMGDETWLPSGVRVSVDIDPINML